MAIETIFAHLSCSDIETSASWYGKLFGREATRKPMAGLLEWQFSPSAAVQLFEDGAHAGTSTLTLGVRGIEAERARLADAGLEPGDIEPASHHWLVRLNDPDNNLIVLAEVREP